MFEDNVFSVALLPKEISFSFHIRVNIYEVIFNNTIDYIPRKRCIRRQCRKTEPRET
jgi:hypothetical protein